MAGVASLLATMASRNDGGLINGAHSVADWQSGVPLIVQGDIKGRHRVDLNFFPVSSHVFPGGWTGDGINLIRNALLFH